MGGRTPVPEESARLGDGQTVLQVGEAPPSDGEWGGVLLLAPSMEMRPERHWESQQRVAGCTCTGDRSGVRETDAQDEDRRG